MQTTNNKMSAKGVRKYQEKLAEMVNSFLIQALDKDPEEVLRVFNVFQTIWERDCRKAENKFGKNALEVDAWKNIFIRDGYVNITAKPYDAKTKTALLRVIKILEGKTEQQWQRREAKYKLIYLFVKTRFYFRKLFNRN